MSSTYTYTYQIISVDTAARVMEVVYTSPGRQTMHISARLPYKGETIQTIIEMFAPLAYWREQDFELAVPPEVGASGALNVDVNGLAPTVPESLESAKQLKLAEISRERYSREIGGYTMPNGNVLGTDRDDQAKIAGAVAAVQAGFLTVVDWKFANGVFHTLTAEQIINVGRMVTQHVQEQFTWEKLMVEQVLAATTIDEVLAIEV